MFYHRCSLSMDIPLFVWSFTQDAAGMFLSSYRVTMGIINFSYVAAGEPMTTQAIKNAGLKVTLPRTKVLKLLEGGKDRHYTAENIYKILLEGGEEIALATIYRVLTQFETAGLVTRHHFESGHAVFELNDGEHHDHMVDIKTGQVLEFYDEVIEKRQQEIAREHGFTITEHTMVLYGTFEK
jgi:Fur family ferric uptake transcriptional regulator